MRLLTGESVVTEVRAVRKNGEVYWVRNYSQPVWDTAHSRIVRILGAAQDITERKRAEEERDRLFNFSIDLFCIAGFDGYFKQLNPAWEKTLGWTNAELMSKPYIEFVHPADRQATANAAGTLIDGRLIYAFDNRYLCKNGTYKWISWNSYPLVGEGLIFAVARHITERKQAEEKLRLSEELFSKAFYASPAGMTITRIADGKFIDVNDSFLRMFEFNRAEVIGHTSTELNMWTQAERKNMIQKQLESDGLQNFELQARAKSGRIVHIL